MKAQSKLRMASIVSDDALILLRHANPHGWDFRERQVLASPSAKACVAFLYFVLPKYLKS